MFIARRFFPKSRKEKYYFFKYMFNKFEIFVCLAPLLHEVKRNTILNFNSITDSVKSENTWKRTHCNDDAKRIRRSGTSRSRVRKPQGRNKGNARHNLSLLASHGHEVLLFSWLRRELNCAHCLQAWIRKLSAYKWQRGTRKDLPKPSWRNRLAYHSWKMGIIFILKNHITPIPNCTEMILFVLEFKIIWVLYQILRNDILKWWI